MMNQEEALISYLDTNLAEHITSNLWNDPPTDYADYKTKAIRINHNWRQRGFVKKLREGNLKATPLITNPVVTATGSGVTYGGQGQPMEIGRVKKKIDKATARAQGLCYTCGSKGHVSKECPQKKKSSSKPNKEKKSKSYYMRQMWKDMDQEQRDEALKGFLED